VLHSVFNYVRIIIIIVYGCVGIHITIVASRGAAKVVVKLKVAVSGCDYGRTVMVCRRSR
jgi:hypothetical protein